MASISPVRDEPLPPAVAVQSLNHWTPREVLPRSSIQEKLKKPWVILGPCELPEKTLTQKRNV